MSSNPTNMRQTRPDVAPTPVRLHGLDALRAGALGLGIVLHSLLPFVPDMPWFVTDTSNSEVADMGYYLIHLFRMVTFMALAGYFGRMVLHRRGAGAYVKDRLLRIGLPVPVFWPFAVASLVVIGVFGAIMNGTVPPETGPPGTAGDAPDVLLMFSPGQLWFLVVLLECVLITVAVRAIAIRVAGRDRIHAIGARLGSLVASPVGVVVAAIPYVMALVIQGHTDLGLIEPATILPSLTAITAYLGAFLVGWFLHAQPNALERVVRQWPAQLVLAIALSIAGYVSSAEQLTLVGHAAIIGLAGWTWTFALIGICVRHLNRERAVVRYLADASYWSYLMHLPLLITAEVLLAQQPWPIIAKLGVTWLVVGAILLLSYDLFVRSTWIGKWLNGHRRPREIFRSRGKGAAASAPDAASEATTPARQNARGASNG